jgi:hypothetical protein
MNRAILFGLGAAVFTSVWTAFMFLTPIRGIVISQLPPSVMCNLVGVGLFPEQNCSNGKTVTPQRLHDYGR